MNKKREAKPNRLAVVYCRAHPFFRARPFSDVDKDYKQVQGYYLDRCSFGAFVFFPKTGQHLVATEVVSCQLVGSLPVVLQEKLEYELVGM